MSQCDAVISGSFAIQFFDDVFWPESDLDLYVQSEHAENFRKYLCGKEGYVQKAEDCWDSYIALPGSQVEDVRLQASSCPAAV